MIDSKLCLKAVCCCRVRAHCHSSIINQQMKRLFSWNKIRYTWINVKEKLFTLKIRLELIYLFLVFKERESYCTIVTVKVSIILFKFRYSDISILQFWVYITIVCLRLANLSSYLKNMSLHSQFWFYTQSSKILNLAILMFTFHNSCLCLAILIFTSHYSEFTYNHFEFTFRFIILFTPHNSDVYTSQSMYLFYTYGILHLAILSLCLEFTFCIHLTIMFTSRNWVITNRDYISQFWVYSRSLHLKILMITYRN